jgi:guanine deaminase
MATNRKKLSFYRATILNPKSDTECEFWKDGVLVTLDGKVKEILDYKIAVDKYLLNFSATNCFEFNGKVLIPGFFDMHFHWVQDDVRLMGKDSLLQWLDKYTFPAENKFSNKKYAQNKAKSFFKRLTSTGTIGGACYSSIHSHALDAAMKEVVGDFVIGDVVMTMNSPEFLKQEKSAAKSQIKQHFQKYKKRFAFTPRFAITTHPDVMEFGGKMADKRGNFKQTHLSETKNEIDYVLSIYKKMDGFQKIKTYTEIYQKTGMLGENSLMGHAIHLSSREIAILKATKTALIHCPTSNAPCKQLGLGSGKFNYEKIEKSNIRWALASDIGGGPFLSMFDVMRSFVDQHKKKSATYTKALYRSTLAGAQILKLDKSKGNLNSGKEANFIIVDFPKKQSFISAETCLFKIVQSMKNNRKNYDKIVAATFYNGTAIYRRD